MQYCASSTSHMNLRYFFSAIKKHADRLEVLDLYLDSLQSVDALNSLFAKVFQPRIETLRVSLSVNRSASTWAEISFFKGHWHHTLQHLQLHGVRLPSMGYGELRDLRSLVLTASLGQMILNTAEILRALSNSPNLEVLQISSITQLGGELSAENTNPVTPVLLAHLRDITLRLPAASLRAFLRSIQTIKLIYVDIETTMPQEDESAWTKVLLTDEIQPFVQVMESALHSAPQISTYVTGPKMSLWTDSTHNELKRYNASYVHLTFTGNRLAEVGKWMAECLDLGSAKVTLHIEDSTSWMDAVPFILSKFHNTVDLKLDGDESVSQRALDFLCTPLYTDATGSQHFPVPRLASINVQVHEPSSVISMLERRYIQHGSTDATSTRYPLALSRLRLHKDMGSSALHSTIEKRSASGLPGAA
ncbi:hypothetical protein FS837_011442 [Tulasnella sp. UAMH 9824]|nr:hypothetical protein FS837_011442 [Tulasnella sp. UAMH 9824]